SGGPALPVHNEGLVGRGRRTRRLNADALQAELQKIVTIPNSCDLGVFRPDAARRAATRAALGVRDDQLVVLYTGAMGRSNAVDDIVQTARLLAEDARIVWWFAGDGAEAGKLRQVAAGSSGDSGGPGAPRTGGSGPVRGIDACPPAERPGHLCGLPASRFFGSLPREKIVELCQAADVALVTFMHAPFFHENSPNKFFDAIAAGLPVIFNRSTWLEADIAAYGCGFVCAGEQPAAAMASRLRELAADPELCRRMGAGARRLAEERYSRDGLAQKYLEALQ
ncbi:MAG: glycosyltransferase family 4 protein, partial [Kiritimatiellia bacterium]